MSEGMTILAILAPLIGGILLFSAPALIPAICARIAGSRLDENAVRQIVRDEMEETARRQEGGE